MHNNGPTLIYDKSTAQGLSNQESYWLHTLYNVVMTSIFLVELMGNLEKKSKTGKSPEAIVASLSNKIPSWAFTPTVPYRELIYNNLFGGEVQMDGRPLLGGARHIDLPDGKSGYWFDEAPEAEIIRRWQSQDFTGAERVIAAQWKRDLETLDLTPLKRDLRALKERRPDIKTDDDLMQFVVEFVRNPREKYHILKLCLDVFDISRRDQKMIIERWKLLGRPMLCRFAPYAEYALLIEVFFMVGVVFDAIADTRPKHRSDFAYFYYLPFTKLFTSSDKLHKRFAPFFMRKDQAFCDGQKMKEDLVKLTAYYESLPEEVKDTGTARYARFPPLEGDFVISKIYDRFVPGWREEAAQPPMSFSKEESDAFMARMKPFMDAIEQDRKRKGNRQ